ncbi:MAG: fumarylacetoacetate hydrolase family protein [Maricaulaceae bacterium]
MKFVTFTHNDREHFGALKDDKIVDLTDAFGSLRETLAADRFEEAKTAAQGQAATIALADVVLRPVVTDAEKYFCIGVNYANRNAEYKDGSEAPKWPSVFMRSRESFVGHNEFILRPPESDKLDYEGEIVLVVGKEGRRIAEEDALDHIAGMTLMNEGTLRDWVRHAKFNVTQGKNFEKTGSIGPYMVTMDEIDDVTNMDIQTRVNGELRQDDNTSNMMFPIRFIVAYLSRFARLRPGDIIATGTPNGAGARFEPPKYLIPGDVVEITSPALGTLRNEVKDEFPA